MKKLLLLFLALIYVFGACSQSIKCKQRLIVTTDLGGADPDDTQSLIHLLVCSDVVDIEGIISSSSWIDCPDWTSEITKVIDDYSIVLPILRKHSGGFRAVDYLHVLDIQLDTWNDGQLCLDNQRVLHVRYLDIFPSCANATRSCGYGALARYGGRCQRAYL